MAGWIKEPRTKPLTLFHFNVSRSSPLGLPGAVRYAAPLVALASVAVAGLIWRAAVRHYQGAGS